MKTPQFTKGQEIYVSKIDRENGEVIFENIYIITDVADKAITAHQLGSPMNNFINFSTTTRLNVVNSLTRIFFVSVEEYRNYNRTNRLIQRLKQSVKDLNPFDSSTEDKLAKIEVILK